MAQKRNRQKTTNSPGRFSFDGLDRVMHEKARLGILSSLAANEGGLLFNDLKQLCSLTDGNLNRHLAVLDEAGLIEAWRGRQGGRPQTLYRLSAIGRRRFAAYIDVLERIVANAQPDERTGTSRKPSSDDWSPA